MKVHYENKKLEKLLTDEFVLKRHFQKNDALKIMARIELLESAENLSLVSPDPPPRRHKLTGNYNECWAVSYSKNDRIIFKPTGKYDIKDLTTIKEIEIIEMNDYH